MRWQIALLVLFAAAVAAFGHIAEDYLTSDPLVRWDVEFARWLHEHSSSTLVSIFKILTYAGNAIVLACLTLLAGVLLARRRRLNDVVLLFVAALGIEVLNGLLKLAFHRPRPELAFVHLDTYSFPSGHAAASAAVYATLAVLAARETARTRNRILIGTAAAILVCIVSFSRLYLGVHYLSDVLAGISLGLAWAAGCLFLYVTLRDRDVRAILPTWVTAVTDRLARE